MEDLKQHIENSNLIYAAMRNFPNPVLQSDETANDSDKTFTVPANKIWTVYNIHIEFTSTGTVGDRQIEIRCTDDADDIIAQCVAGAVQAASLTRIYEFCPHCQDKTAFIDTDKIFNRCPCVALPAGYKILILDNNAVDAAADDMIIQMMVNEWDVS